MTLQGFQYVLVALSNGPRFEPNFLLCSKYPLQRSYKKLLSQDLPGRMFIALPASFYVVCRICQKHRLHFRGPFSPTAVILREPTNFLPVLLPRLLGTSQEALSPLPGLLLDPRPCPIRPVATPRVLRAARPLCVLLLSCFLNRAHPPQCLLGQAKLGTELNSEGNRRVAN